MSQYDSLKDYLELNYKKIIIQGMNDYIKKKFSESENRVKDITIRTLAFGATFPMDCLTLMTGVSATLFDSVDNNSDTRYYNIMLSGDITIGFSNLCVMIVEEVTEESLQTETVLSLFGLPDVSRDSLEDEAKRIHAVLTARIPTNNKHRYWFPVIKIKEKYGMKMWPAKLDNSILGQIRFVPSRADIYDIKDMSKCYYDEPIPSNSILLNSKYYTNEVDSCDDVITTAHEFVHWYHHQLYFLIMQLLDKGIVEMSCSSEPIAFDDSISLKDKAYWYAEWQANELSMRLTMPKHLVERAIDEYNKDESVQSVHNHADMSFSGMYYQNMIYKLSCDFNVPVEIMKRRLRQLGYDFADGTFITVDDCTYQSFTFAYGTLKENETFIIDRSNYERLLSENKDFAELIEGRHFVYIGYVVCFNHPKYTKLIIQNDVVKYVLSDYAREHAEECCYKFKYTYTSNHNSFTEYTISHYLCKLDDIKLIITTDADDKGVSINAKQLKMILDKIKEDEKKAGKIKARMLLAEITTFSAALKYHKKQIKGLTYQRIEDTYGIPVDTLKAYVAPLDSNRYRKPSLEHMMLLCHAFRLPHDTAIDFLTKAKTPLDENKALHKLYDHLLRFTDEGINIWDKYLTENGGAPLKTNIEGTDKK